MRKETVKKKPLKKQDVRLQIVKNNSFSTTDTLSVEVYKSGNTEKRVTWGWLFEGQKKGSLYIRNSKNKKAEPGTYYVVISKEIDRSGFTYTIKRLK